MANAERLQGTLDFILTHPDQHRQGEWFKGAAREGHNNNGAVNEECGTVGCFAGWATALYGPEEGWRQSFHSDSIWRQKTADGDWVDAHVAEVAASVLGLDGDEQDTLFDGENTVDQLTDMVSDLVENGHLTAAESCCDGFRCYYDEREYKRREGCDG